MQAHPETTNCGNIIFHDWHLEIFETPMITPHGSVIKLQLFLKSRLGQNDYSTGRPPPPGKALRGQLRHGVF